MMKSYRFYTGMEPNKTCWLRTWIHEVFLAQTGMKTGVVILSFASKSDDANSSITEPALQALGAANLQD